MLNLWNSIPDASALHGSHASIVSLLLCQAPGPEEVNWPTLWETFDKRTIRALLTTIPIAAMIIFPIGIFAGV